MAKDRAGVLYHHIVLEDTLDCAPSAPHKACPLSAAPLRICSEPVEVPSGDNNHFLRTQSAFLRHCPVPVNNIPALGNKSHKKAIISPYNTRACQSFLLPSLSLAKSFSPLHQWVVFALSVLGFPTSNWKQLSDYLDNDWAWLSVGDYYCNAQPPLHFWRCKIRSDRPCHRLIKTIKSESQ